VEVTRVSMYAVCMKGELRPLRDDSAVGWMASELRSGDQTYGGAHLQLPEYFGTLALVH
jgi:hypothetical protein